MFALKAVKIQAPADRESASNTLEHRSIVSGKPLTLTAEGNPSHRQRLEEGEKKVDQMPGPVPSGDFSQIPTFSHERESHPGMPPFLSPISTTNVMQAKLVVGDSNDALEHQAEHAADMVMRMRDPTPPIATVPPQLSRKCGACKDEEKKALQKKPAGTEGSVGLAPPVVNKVLRSSGAPLDAQMRAFFEPRFRSDFSGVRVHTDEQAARSARAVNASAYAVGSDIVFGSGNYTPQTSAGKRLLAHELAHVVQQEAGRPLTSPTATDSDSGELHRQRQGDESSERSGAESEPVVPVAGAGIASSNPKIMRSHLLTKDFKIRNRVLKGESEFQVKDGGLSVTAEGSWQRTEDDEDSAEDEGTPAHGPSEMPECGPKTFNIELNDDSYFLSGYGGCDFPIGRPASQQWTGLPDEKYHLIISVGDHNPACTLVGTVELEQKAGLTGSSCTKLPPGPLEILHDGLTIAGMVPFLGAIPDVANAGIYLVEGDWLNAGLSAAMAVPALGEAAAAIKIGDKAVVRVSGHAIEKAGAKEIGEGLKEAKAAQAAKVARDAEAAAKEAKATKAAIAGAEEVRLSVEEYEKALEMVFPSQSADAVAKLVDNLGQRAAERAMENPRFVSALNSNNMTLAGTFFHSAAATEARAIAPGLLPQGWRISAEETLKAGKGGSRLDILLEGPAGELVEFDWKTSGKSALSTGSRREMVRHAGEVVVQKQGRTLARQESRSWMDYVRPLTE